MVMWERIIDIAGYQLAWFACILGAAWGYPLLGPTVVGVRVGVQLARTSHRRADVRFLVAAGLVGYLADSVLVRLGALSFVAGQFDVGPSPLWMAALWINLAVTLRHSLDWLTGRYLWGVVLGVVSGPLAYAAGVRMGAARFGWETWPALVVVGVEWALAMPCLLWLATPTWPWRAQRPPPARSSDDRAAGSASVEP
jgi:hypothetical protein